MDKARYFLSKFKSLEWSGPAWYSHEKDEDGFPTTIRLEYFHPLDLGTSGTTDWDGKDLVKIYKPLRKEFPEIGKSWVQGNIHSHHSMGAFFSGTDEQQCVDGANENFYYSLVVSTKPGKELHFGMSYPDQFGQIHIIEIDDIEVEENRFYDQEWKKQAKFIKKNKKPEGVTLYNSHKYNNQGNGQATLFGLAQSQTKEETEQETKQQRYEDHIDMLSYNSLHGMDNEDAMSWQVFDRYDELILDYEKGRIKKRKFKQELKKIGVDENGFPLPS
tara:strand:+ start:236 stop:1057 length:822 start_codon:yes stop_codon:yes gene_type:complete